MSAEVEAGEIVVRLLVNGVAETIRVVPTVAMTVGQLGTRLFLYARALTHTAGRDIVNSPNGADHIQVPEEFKDALKAQLDKWKVKYADVDCLPNDRMWDIVVKREDTHVISSILESMGVEKLKVNENISIIDGQVTFDKTFKEWADELAVGKQNIHEALNRKKENLDTARLVPYVVADRLNPSNYILVDPRIMDVNGEKKVISNYTMYKDGKLNGETEDLNVTDAESWNQKKMAMVERSGVNPEDLIYFDTHSDHQMYESAYKRSLTGEDRLLKDEVAIDVEKFNGDKKYRELVCASAEKKYNELLIEYADELKGKNVNPMTAQTQTTELEFGQTLSREAEERSGDVIGLVESIETLKGASPVANREEYVKNLHEEYGKLSNEISSLGENAQEVYREMGETLSAIDSNLNLTKQFLSDNTLVTSQNAEVKVQIFADEHDALFGLLDAQKKYLDAVKGGKQSEIDLAIGSLNNNREFLRAFNADREGGLAKAMQEVTMANIRKWRKGSEL